MTDEVDMRLRKYVDAVRYRLFRAAIRGVLPQIPNFGRRLLALQRFVAALRDPDRGQTWIDSRWAMTREEFLEWRDSPEFAVQSRELREIVARFNAASPGHRLRAGSRFRPLGDQINSWNFNHTVGAHAPTMLARARREIRNEADYPDLGPYIDEASGLLSHAILPVGIPGIPLVGLGALAGGLPGAVGVAGAPTESQLRNAAIERFVQWLAAQRTGRPSITVATPGLSNHGVGQAIDFQVLDSHGTRIVGASNPARWRALGWADRLADAVRPSRHFTGPLLSPDEPWHWTFDPTP